MSIEVFNRYEYKYVMKQKTYETVLVSLDNHRELDRHHQNRKPCTIATIYCDTPDNYLIRNSLSKPAYKEKLCLRAYGVPNIDTMVFFEIKKKINGMVNKRRTALTLSDAYKFTASGNPPPPRDDITPQVVKEIAYWLLL